MNESESFTAHRRKKGRNMKKYVYLDNAATSHPKPKSVAKAMADAVEKGAGNPGRGFHQPGMATTRIIFQAREEAARFFGLLHPERLVFTGGATQGLNLALKGLLGPGDRVAVSRLEHNAVTRPLQTLKTRGVLVEHAPSLDNGTPDPSRIPDVKMLVTTVASNVTGAMADIGALAEACRKKGALLVLDAAQTAGSVPMPSAGEVSVLVAPGHKGLLGPQGVGLAWFAPGVEPEPLVE
ncbi:MAG: aminotransferase class V-fold PLP-dependent enzyme, partial [Nitrospinota bacterium]|nr:aminotransferase class V-fold PLP-dependent enzyme [Nitrospinota bacterium]